MAFLRFTEPVSYYQINVCFQIMQTPGRFPLFFVSHKDVFLLVMQRLVLPSEYIHRAWQKAEEIGALSCMVSLSGCYMRSFQHWNSSGPFLELSVLMHSEFEPVGFAPEVFTACWNRSPLPSLHFLNPAQANESFKEAAIHFWWVQKCHTFHFYYFWKSKIKNNFL